MYSKTFNSNQNNYDKQSIMAIILQNLPRECSLTKIEYEGPRIALYSNQPEFLLQNNHVLPNIVNLIKKRIVLRLDESIRKSEKEVTNIIEKLIPNEVSLKEKITNTLINQTG